MPLSKEEFARKRTHDGCLVQIESPVIQDNCYRRDRIFNKNSYDKVNVRKFVTHEYGMRYFLSILMLHRKCNMADPMLHTKI